MLCITLILKRRSVNSQQIKMAVVIEIKEEGARAGIAHADLSADVHIGSVGKMNFATVV